MEIPLTYALKFSQTQSFRSERDELISKFLNHDIKLTKNKKLEPATAKDIALLTAHIPTNSLHALYKKCLRARSFSRYFFTLIKTTTV